MCRTIQTQAFSRKTPNRMCLGTISVLYAQALWAFIGPAPANAEGPTWRNTNPPRRGHAMAYDSRRGVVVRFGGLGQEEIGGDTWEYDGSRWALRSTAGPSPRWGHAMSY